MAHFTVQSSTTQPSPCVAKTLTGTQRQGLAVTNTLALAGSASPWGVVIVMTAPKSDAP